jgi:ADP-heptose:LPS heptosyltransferase
MKPDTMRWIDRWVGVPLCFAADLCFAPRRWFAGPPAGTPRKVLFIELSEMGSVILADPAMRRLQAATGAELYFLIFARNAPSTRILGTIPEGHVRTLRADNLLTLVVDVCAFLVWCRREGIDAVIDLELFSRLTALLTAFSGARFRVGFHRFRTEGLYRGRFLTHEVAYNPLQHIAKNFAALVHALLAPIPEQPYAKVVFGDEALALARVTVPDAERARLRAILQGLCPHYQPARDRVVLINPNASDLLPQRRWPAESFAAVIRLLLARHPDIVTVITGSPAEVEGARQLEASVQDPRCVSAAGELAFGDLVPLYAVSALMLTNDSGPAHFSAVTELRTFVLYGPETPVCYGSLGRSTAIYARMSCSPCVSAANHRATTCTDNQCLTVIRPEYVQGLMSAALEPGSPPG